MGVFTLSNAMMSLHEEKEEWKRIAQAERSRRVKLQQLIEKGITGEADAKEMAVEAVAVLAKMPPIQEEKGTKP